MKAYFQQNSAWILLLAISILRLCWAVLVPISLDEAYYAAWSRHLAFGYLDHPPGVAWLAGLTQVFGPSPLASRILVVICATIGGVYAIRITRLVAPKNIWAEAVAVVLTQLSIGGFALGILLNPDSLMGLAWVISIHEFLLILKGHRRRWISLGGIIAIGLMGKYIMVLVPVSIIAFCCFFRRDLLHDRWFWRGIAFGLLVFSPHIYWNAQHHWATVKFQVHRGFESKHHSPEDPADLLPLPQAPQENSPEFRLSKELETATADESMKIPKPKSIKDQIPALLRPLFALFEFFSAQLALWGVFALVVIAFPFSLARRSLPADLATRFLCWIAFFPLLFFGLISVFSKVEANWAGMHIFGLAFLIATTARLDRLLQVGLVIHLSIFSAFAIAPEKLAERVGLKRIQKEISGYDRLSELMRTIETPIFADTFQTVSMLRFHLPDKTVQQWPGLARPSEFTRNPQPEYWQKRLHAEGFSIVLSVDTLPSLAGFEARQAARIIICPGGLAQVFRAGEYQDAKQPCPNRVKSWLIGEYRPI